MDLALSAPARFGCIRSWHAPCRLSTKVRAFLVFWRAYRYRACRACLLSSSWGELKGPIWMESRPIPSERKLFWPPSNTHFQQQQQQHEVFCAEITVLPKQLVRLERFLPSWRATKFRLFFIADHVIAFFHIEVCTLTRLWRHH